MKRLAALLLSALLGLTGCQPQAESASNAKVEGSPRVVPPPPPPPPVISPEDARRDALAMGIGDCSDLERIEHYPFRAEEAWDPYFNRIYYQVPAYRACLVGSLADFSEIAPLHLGPGILVRTRAALAFIVLVDAGVAEWDTCKPEAIRAKEQITGAVVFFDWLEDPANQPGWSACMQSALARATSSKSKPKK